MSPLLTVVNWVIRGVCSWPVCGSSWGLASDLRLEDTTGSSSFPLLSVLTLKIHTERTFRFFFFEKMFWDQSDN